MFAIIFIAILYELLLDGVFAEIDRQESRKDSTFTTEEMPSSGWTEVKNKQKG